jgi:hypothetical protein
METQDKQAQTPLPPQEQQGVQGWLKIVIAVIFYAGLTGFLLSSIDHVAWFFHLYEPASQPGDGWAMVPSYGKAGALDLAIFFLAYVAATGQAADKVLTWTFTIILSCVSLYANYIYAMFFSPQHQSDIWHIQILWGLTTTGWLSPIIASSYPIFAMIFMYLIERVISRKAETPEEMRVRLHALKEKKEIEQAIKAVTKGQVKGAAIEAIDNGLDVFNHFRGRLAKQVQAPVNGVTETQEDVAAVPSTSDLDASNDPSMMGEQERQSGVNEPSEKASTRTQSEGKQTSETASIPSSIEMAMERLNRLSSGSCLPLEEAATVLGVSLQYAKTMRSKGQLTTHPKNEEIVTVASVKKALETRAKADKRTTAGRILSFNPASIMGARAEQESETGIDRLDITLKALKEHPALTDEELAVKLDLKRPASARFWRLKADEIMKASSTNHQPTTEPTSVEASS